jgi:anti-sigma B factor antagonist
MDINAKIIEQVTVVELAGDIDGKTAPEAQQQILAVVQPAAKILLDMSQVAYMSSAGLRVLLATHRQVTSQKAALGLVGLSEEIQDTMSATGFLNFFTTYHTLEDGLAALS